SANPTRSKAEQGRVARPTSRVGRVDGWPPRRSGGGQNPAYALTRHMGKGGGFGPRLSPAPGSAGRVDVLVEAEQVGGVVGAFEPDEAGVVRTVGLVHQAGVVGGHVVHVPVLGQVRP